MTLVTVYALIADDIKLLTTEVNADKYFTFITICSFFMFLAELIAASIGKKGYWLSFFFWLDLIATLSIISDIEPLMQLMTGDGSGGAGADTVTLARASRGARIGTRAGRMARVIRLIRLVRVVKLYKSANQAMVNKEGAAYEENKSKLNELKAMKKAGGSQQEGQQAGADGDINLKEMLLNDQMESKVGKKLSEITTKRVIILVLIMLFSQPIFSVSTYMQEPNSYDYGLLLIREFGPLTDGG